MKRRLPYGAKKCPKGFKGETWQQKKAKLAESEVSVSTPLEPAGGSAKVVEPGLAGATSLPAGASAVTPVVASASPSTSVTSTPVASTPVTSSSVVASTSVDTPIPQTASVRKLTSSSSVKGKAQVISDSECVGKGNRVISVEALSQFVCLMRCPDCEAQDLCVDEGVGNRRGLVTKLSVFCVSCEWEHILTNPYSPEAKGLNCKSVFGARLMGKGRAGLEIMSAVLDLPPPVTDNSYSDHNVHICGVLRKHAEAEQLAAVGRLRHMHKAGPNDIVDVEVTFDGTWSKRGFTAPYGVCVVISWLTGEVLDTELMSKYCVQCSLYQGAKEGEEYEQWYEKHKAVCTLTHHGSSPAMELAGARKIFSRSVEKYKLRYSTVISDGDSKTISSLNSDEVYGEVPIVKHECVGHIQKRVVAHLKKLKAASGTLLSEARKAVKESKKALDDKKAELQSVQGRGRGRGRRIGSVNIESEVATLQAAYDRAVVARDSVPNFRGRFSDKAGGEMLQLQKYYGRNIRRNVGNLDSMVRDCWACFYHSCSHDGDPQHDHCPTGPDTWCTYNRAILKEEDLSHSRPPLIPPDLAPAIKEVWAKLCDRDLLARCVLGATQNQNESFNAVLWNRCSKTDFSSPESVQVSVYLAVLTFNEGQQSLLPIIEELGGTKPSPFCERVLAHADSCRLYKSIVQHSDIQKKRRQAQKLAHVIHEGQLIEQEGTTYEPGGF